MTKALIYAGAMVLAASLAGCRSAGDVDYADEVHVSSPELISIAPGVQVVADADEPLFVADGEYWLYRDGYWFRATDHRGGFVRVDFSVVPETLRGLEHPETYARYRHRPDRTGAARPTPTRTRSRPQAPTPPPPPAEGPAPQPTAPTPQPKLPSQTREPTDPPPPYPPPPADRPARPTSPPGQAPPVQVGDEPPVPSTDEDTVDETKRIDERRDPDTTDE